MVTGRKSSRRKSASTLPANRGRGRWLAATYDPVTLFSLRTTLATSKGGKTLLVPTPYAFKMGLLDACFRRFDAAEALERANEVFELVKWREVCVKPPEACVVQNTFIKVLDQSREPIEGPFRQTIAYREYVHYHGQMVIALASAELTTADEELLSDLMAHLNYLGKRGSFLQFRGVDVIEGTLSDGFTVPGVQMESTPTAPTIQVLDDFAEGLCQAMDGFERVSTYGSGTIKLYEHRALTVTSIPYQRRSASKHFTWYERV